MPRLPAFLNQKPPLEHYVFGNLENPFAKHGPDLIRQPVIEVRAAIGLTDQLNAEANLGEGYSADVKVSSGQPATNATTFCSGLDRLIGDRRTNHFNASDVPLAAAQKPCQK